MRADAMRNRLKVLEAARAAFAEAGANAQMDDIARRAGVGVGTVYRHFPTKESLATAMVRQHFEQISAFIREEMLPDPDPWRALRRSFEFCGEMQERDRGYAEVIALTGGGAPISKAALMPTQGEADEMLALSAVFLQRAQDAGVVRRDLTPGDLSPFYIGISAVVQAGVPDWRRYIGILLDGLRPRPQDAAADG